MGKNLFYAYNNSGNPGYKIKTELLSMEAVKNIIFRWIFIYYNRKRVYTANDGGYSPEIKRRMYLEKTQIQSAA